MSWQAMDAIDKLPLDVVGPLAFRVLLKLANVADQRGERAFRSKSELANELGRSQRSVQRAFRELEHAALALVGDQSFVQHIRSDKRPTVYNINMRWSSEVEQPELDAWQGDSERGDTVIHSGERGDTGGANGETTGVAQGTVVNSINNLSTRGDHSSDPCPTSPKLGHLRLDGRGACARCGLTPDQVYDPRSKDILRREEVTS